MKVLISYYSESGKTEKMAQYIAEGVRFHGDEAVTKKMKDIKDASEMAGYDGYIFGSPTYSLDVPDTVKDFLLMAEKAGLEGKMSGAFGPYTHDVAYGHENHAPAIILDTLERTSKMRPFELGPFMLQEEEADTSRGMETCQDYGRVFGENLSA
jgi:flavodoxin